MLSLCRVGRLEAPPGSCIGIGTSRTIDSSHLPIVRRASFQKDQGDTQVRTYRYPARVTAIVLDRVNAVLVASCSTAGIPAQRQGSRTVPTRAIGRRGLIECLGSRSKGRRD